MPLDRKPIVPVTDDWRDKFRQFRGFIILGQDAKVNHPSGYVERSFSMGWDAGHVLLALWHPEWGRIKTEAACRRDVDHWLASTSIIASGMADVRAWDIHDPDLPIVIDLEAWITAQAFDPNTLSGVSDKFRARNAPFAMREV
jgi:hypothetical protein